MSIAPYVPGVTPTAADQIPRYLRTELAKLRTTIEQLSALAPQTANEAPRGPVEGMIRLSVSPWRPVFGQVSDRLVVFNGAAWVYASTL